MITHLPGLIKLVVNIIAWLIIHVGVSLPIDKIQAASFNQEAWLYRERRWEKVGTIYQRFLKIKAWKEFLPDGAALTENKFRKKHLGNPEVKYIQKFIEETCRAELIHWLIFLFSPLFFIWNEWWIGIMMIAYGLMVNMPCIITQRYNRIRLRRIFNCIVQR